VRPHGVVVAPPALNDDLSLLERIEDLAIEQLISKPRIEALDEPVLPGAARGDVSRLGSHSRHPVLDGFGCELRAVV
jgi:hypothetical protein